MQDSTACYFQEKFKYKNTNRIKLKQWKRYTMLTIQIQSCYIRLIADKVDIKAKNINRD